MLSILLQLGLLVYGFCETFGVVFFTFFYYIILLALYYIIIVLHVYFLYFVIIFHIIEKCGVGLYCEHNT